MLQNLRSPTARQANNVGANVHQTLIFALPVDYLLTMQASGFSSTLFAASLAAGIAVWIGAGQAHAQGTAPAQIADPKPESRPGAKDARDPRLSELRNALQANKAGAVSPEPGPAAGRHLSEPERAEMRRQLSQQRPGMERGKP